ncbi:carboxylesterase/lipase family protein [Cecembia rubra]|uniref:carboxylesterase/lipase family protein n=1 Tax=Cecembia rubra TaxID=1485585 RepID=UPI002714A7A5|nr:carboxylesterase family protein [Cecembia rubra]
MTKVFLSFGFFLFTLALVLAQGKDGFPVQAKIKNGTIEGFYDTKSGIQKYFGIPFAKPPIGDLRWKAPQPIENWIGVKETKEFGPRPVQKLIWGDMNSRSNGVSEDCLYLNVWSPASRNSKNLPVLVYFFGGGFVAGDGSEPRYDGENMAKEGIVVVTINYRLGVFGFLAHPELSAEAPYKASGNYGLLDQALALQWVQENIAAFGGDPKKVTIAGESAGSISVSYQMASPLSKNLIAAAIGESGAGITALAPTSLKEAEQVGMEFFEKFGIKSIAEARKLPTRDIYEMYNESGRFGFPVVLDGYLLPKTLTEIFNAGEQAQVPLLLGWNTQENPGAAFMQGLSLSKENFIIKVKQAYPNDYTEVLNLYPHETEEQVAFSAMDLAGDRFISYSTWKWFDLHRKNSGQPVYRYLYAKLRPPLVDETLEAGLAGGTSRRASDAPHRPKDLGAPHAAEIEYAMGNLDRIKEFAWTADDYKTSETMFKYFANFIKTHNPNGVGLPEWPKASANDENPPVMVIDIASKAIKAQNDARYKFHDHFYGNNK